MEEKKFYKNFLGMQNAKMKNGILLCRSEKRDIPLNKHFAYKMIVTDYEGKRIVSLSNDFPDTTVEELCNKFAEKDIESVYQILCQQNMDYRLSFMYRMLRKGERIQQESMEWQEKLSREELPEKEEMLAKEKMIEKDEILAKQEIPEKEELLAKEEMLTMKENLAFVFMPELKKQVALFQNQPAGYAKISDIYDGFGNIVIFVRESLRQKGVATVLLHKLIQHCEEESIIPMYLVKRENKASFGLAKKFGFEIVQQELVLCEEI